MPVWLRAVVFLALVPGTVAGWVPWYVAGPSRDAIGNYPIGLAIAAAGLLVLL